MADEIDPGNKFMVGVSGGRIVIHRPPHGTISNEDALNFAAWLVALADRDDKFPAILQAVQST